MTPFPLLRLPRLALIPVFQHMKLIDIIAFSLISKRTVNLSKCFSKVSHDFIDLVVGSHDIEIRIDDLTLYFNENEEMKWTMAGLSTKHFIQSVLAVTKCSSLDKVILNEKPEYDVLSVLNVVPKISHLQISCYCTNTFITQALQSLTPVTSSIILLKVPFSNREEFQRFWMGDVKCLSILYNYLSSFQFNIDDLLASNAVKLELRGVSLSLRDLNRFFSCWLKKTSNQRLMHLSVKLLGHFDEDVLLDGLNATRFTEQQVRHFQSISSLPVFTGGFEVRRIDGQLAAITFGSLFENTFINFDS